MGILPKVTCSSESDLTFGFFLSCAHRKYNPMLFLSFHLNNIQSMTVDLLPIQGRPPEFGVLLWGFPEGLSVSSTELTVPLPPQHPDSHWSPHTQMNLCLEPWKLRLLQLEDGPELVRKHCLPPCSEVAEARATPWKGWDVLAALGHWPCSGEGRNVELWQRKFGRGA